ncbi:MAG: sigma-70 family RNA polymerase sigma factor [Thermoleophilia bacterium]|nr:sigma-70 family RNA polymerase sigma factor [Thermoleophilia bacterium]
MAGEHRELLQAWCAERDTEARGRLIELHLPLVRALAQRYASRGEQMEDLTQVGAVGLIKAVDRYDPARGSSFAAYAVPTIEGEIRRHLRDSARPVRLPRRARRDGQVVLAVPLESAPAASRDALAEHDLEQGEERALLEAGLRALPRRQRRIVQLHYFGNVSQRGIASELGLSQVHVSRLLRDSLGKLRQEIGQT